MELDLNYENERALWESKLEFYQQQKDLNRRELLECQHKFEETLLAFKNKESQELNWTTELNLLK